MIADIVRISVNLSNMKEQQLARPNVCLMGLEIDSQRGENLNSLCIAACQEVDQVFLVGLAKYDPIEQPLLAQALEPRRVTALRQPECPAFDPGIHELPPRAESDCIAALRSRVPLKMVPG